MSRSVPALTRATILVLISLSLGRAVPSPGAATLIACCVVSAAAACSVWRSAGSGAARVLALALALASFAAGAASSGRAAADCRLRLRDGAALQAVGALEDQPGSDGATTLRMESPCAGSVRATVRMGAPAAGDRAVFTGRWTAWPPQAGGARDPDRAGSLTVVAVRPAPADGRHPLLRLRGAAELRVRELFGTRAPVVEAMLLARRGALDFDTRQRYVQAGLAHVLAISGLHVGVVAGVLLVLAGAARCGPAAAGLIAAGGTLAYVGFLGAPPAAARAAVQILLLLLARLLQRPSDPLALLAAAALVLAAFEPSFVADAGYQLSFCGALGLVLLRRPVLERLPARLPPWLREGLAAGVAATAATAPVAALRFGQAAPVGLPASLAAVPIVAVAVPGAALALAVGSVNAAAGRILAGGVAPAFALLDGVATAAAAVPGGHGTVSGAEAVAWLAATGAAGWVLLSAGRWGRVRTAVAAGVAVACVAAGPALLELPRRHALDVYAIDVGQGDALAVRTPHGRWISIDTGPRTPTFDAGARRVVPFLRRLGAKRIDLLVLTHPDADHVGGAASVLREMPVGAVLDPGLAVGKRPLLQTLEGARVRGVRWYRGAAGEVLRVDGVRIEVLAPTGPVPAGAPDANDYSLIFRLVYGRFAVLFDGDAPAAVEEEAARGGSPVVGAEVLKVGHHGSRTSSAEGFLDAVGPRVALVSVGRRNRYGHPSPEVIERLLAHGIRVYRTDRQGTIRVRGWPDGRLQVTTQR